MPVTPSPVLMVTPRWARDGGVATHVIASATVLARSGVSVHVVAAQVDRHESIPGVVVHESRRLLSRSASAAERLGEAMAIGPALVHMHTLDDPDLVAFMRRTAPVVIGVHGWSACTSGVHYFRPGEECTRRHGPGCIPNLLLRGCGHTFDPRGWPASYRAATRAVQALREADLVVSYSSVVDRHLSANGVTARRRIPLFTTVAPKTGTGYDSRRRVVFAGRVVASKGVGVLIRAARKVEAEFVICGEGWQLDSVRKLARRLDVLDRISFKGWLPADELASELAEASVVVIPVLWPEPFGLAGIEAHAAGRPVVASATGGVEDWLEEGVNGLLVRPGDASDLARALNELLDDPHRQAAMGEAGRHIVQRRFTAEHHLEALAAAYEVAHASWEGSDRERGATVARAQLRASSAS